MFLGCIRQNKQQFACTYNFNYTILHAAKFVREDV